MSLDWTDIIEFSKESVERHVRTEAGNYRLVSKGNDGKYYRFYAGQATNLRARLLQHLSAAEENDCGYRFAYVASQSERDAIEREDIGDGLDCNKQTPQQ